MPKSTIKLFQMPEEQIRFIDTIWLSNKSIKIAWRRHLFLDEASIKNGKILSKYLSDGAAHTIVVPKGANRIIYVNGLIGAIKDTTYLEAMLQRLAALDLPLRQVAGNNIKGCVLTSARNTKFVLAYNYDISKPAKVIFRIPIDKSLNCSELMLLYRDDISYQPLQYKLKGKYLEFQDTIHYYGIYQIALSPIIKLEIPEIVIHPGETKELKIKLHIPKGAKTSGWKLNIKSHIPTIVSSLQNVETNTNLLIFSFKLHAKPTIDYGKKTIIIELIGKSFGRTIWLRELSVVRNPNIEVKSRLIDFNNPKVEVESDMPLNSAELKQLNLQLQALLPNNKIVPYEVEIIGGKSLWFKPKKKKAPFITKAPTELKSLPVIFKLSYNLWGELKHSEHKALLAVYPERPPAATYKDAIAAIYIFNPLAKTLEHEIVEVSLKDVSQKENLLVREAEGVIIPSQRLNNNKLLVLSQIPPEGFQTLWLCKNKKSRLHSFHQPI